MTRNGFGGRSSGCGPRTRCAAQPSRSLFLLCLGRTQAPASDFVSWGWITAVKGWVKYSRNRLLNDNSWLITSEKMETLVSWRVQWQALGEFSNTRGKWIFQGQGDWQEPPSDHAPELGNVVPLQWQSWWAGTVDWRDSSVPQYILGAPPRSATDGNGDFRTGRTLVVSFPMVRSEMTLTILLWKKVVMRNS